MKNRRYMPADRPAMRFHKFLIYGMIPAGIFYRLYQIRSYFADSAPGFPDAFYWFDLVPMIASVVILISTEIFLWKRARNGIRLFIGHNVLMLIVAAMNFCFLSIFGLAKEAQQVLLDTWASPITTILIWLYYRKRAALFYDSQICLSCGKKVKDIEPVCPYCGQRWNDPEPDPIAAGPLAETESLNPSANPAADVSSQMVTKDCAADAQVAPQDEQFPAFGATPAMDNGEEDVPKRSIYTYICLGLGLLLTVPYILLIIKGFLSGGNMPILSTIVELFSCLSQPAATGRLGLQVGMLIGELLLPCIGIVFLSAALRELRCSKRKEEEASQ